MSITILGEHIRLIRPEKIESPRIYKDEMPVCRAKRNKRSRTIKEHTGKVVAVCVLLKSGGVRGIRDCSKTYLDVIKLFGILPNYISKVGWELEGRRYVWRSFNHL